MNPYQYPVFCSVCGGECSAHVRDMGADWSGGEFRHKDPSICARILESRQREIERKEQAITAKERG